MGANASATMPDTRPIKLLIEASRRSVQAQVLYRRCAAAPRIG
ncbi:hypothetical protein I553_3268 [Mycobacterium xenopi 4042]|uniref:Uncharacterized protein n=1 Tax=Mycobacterium xenopi 4042 TaxID=1299334 RepID=X8E6C9_MYCXE|nr:hypothetical protein I553_3268 [Mycobacterium xenopi 4042]